MELMKWITKTRREMDKTQKCQEDLRIKYMGRFTPRD
jgi:hypothetical protein